MERDMNVTMASAPAALAAIGSMALKVAQVCATGKPANIAEELKIIFGVMPPPVPLGESQHPCTSCGKIVAECGHKANGETWCNGYELQEPQLPAI